MATIFFAGHGPSRLCGYDKSKYAIVRRQLVDLIEYLHEDMGYDTFVTGGERGVDQLVSCAVHEYEVRNPGMHVKNVIYAPFPGHGSEWPRYGGFSQFEYTEILKLADEINYVLDRKPLSKKKANLAMYERDVGMLHDSVALCAFIPQVELDEKNAHNKIKSCVNLARRFGRRVFHVDYQLTHEGMKLTGLK